MQKRQLLRYLVPIALAAVVVASASACSRFSGAEPQEKDGVPGLAARGTTMTTVKPTRQDLANRVSLSGKVTINPIFGLVAPVAGQVRYVNVTPPTSTPTRPTKVATVRVGSRNHDVTIPVGAIFSGRLVDDRATVATGMPIVSARYAGYGIVADIDGAQAYKISDALTSVTAQITNGPGPFACAVLGTIAALPAGTIPEPAAQQPPPGQNTPPPVRPGLPVIPGAQEPDPSEATGMRLVCLAPAGTKLINGAAATVEVVTARATNVMVLPVEAVAGSQGNGTVNVVGPNGVAQPKDVVLGLTDGRVVEIKSGLTGDENIAVPGPNLPAGPDGGQGGPGGPRK